MTPERRQQIESTLERKFDWADHWPTCPACKDWTDHVEGADMCEDGKASFTMFRYAPVTPYELLELENIRLHESLQWQPIATAPRDGTALLVMSDTWPGTKSGNAESCCGHNTYVAEWWPAEGDGGAWVCYMDMIQDPVCPIEPTHWRYLPSPPTEGTV